MAAPSLTSNSFAGHHEYGPKRPADGTFEVFWYTPANGKGRMTGWCWRPSLCKSTSEIRGTFPTSEAAYLAAKER